MLLWTRVYMQGFFQVFYPNHTIGLFKRSSVLYSAICEVILDLKSYCTETVKITENNRTNSMIKVCAKYLI